MNSSATSCGELNNHVDLLTSEDKVIKKGPWSEEEIIYCIWKTPGNSYWTCWTLKWWLNTRFMEYNQDEGHFIPFWIVDALVDQILASNKSVYPFIQLRVVV